MNLKILITIFSKKFQTSHIVAFPFEIFKFEMTVIYQNLNFLLFLITKGFY